ncbi:MAG: hypothetical protein GY768_22850 [Planctomycetaceae bacterium]|nr:hypothetical protein [Planctomycetaceae bacterium]
MKEIYFLALTIGWFCATNALGSEFIRIATFEVDASPPLESPVAYTRAREITDPLSARGIILLGSGDPIVICTFDFLGIGNRGYSAWRERLAKAAQTSVDRVTLHALHQHDGPRCDFDAEQILAQHGLAGQRFDPVFCRQLIEKVATALRKSVQNQVTPVTHMSIGSGRVQQVASNRRLLGNDGRVEIMRFSKSTDPQAIEAPEGVIDPWLRMVTFWNEKSPLAVLSYYATHPQSYYGDGDVTSEFVGLARNKRQDDLGIPHLHFNGASGNVAAGKYNDGSREMRPILASRLEQGMKAAWQASRRFPVTQHDFDWRVVPVLLPAADYLDRDQIQDRLEDPNTKVLDKLRAAKELIWLERSRAGQPIELSCLKIGETYLLHLPGELFVEYQLAAQAIKPDSFVAVAAYGDDAPGYIGTAISYSQGGYEVQPGVSRVSPKTEQILIDAIQSLLTDSENEQVGSVSITIDGKFNDWSNIPAYFDPLHDTHDTDHSQAADRPRYVNHPDVDLIEYKVTNDNHNLYFYFRARGQIGRTQAASNQGRAGRYYAIVTLDVDRDKATGYNLHEGGYYPTSDGYDVNAEIEFFDGAENTAHYLNQAIDNPVDLRRSFQEQSRNTFIENRDGPYPAGTITLRPGHYDYYTQWVYHADNRLTFVRDKGPAVQGIARAKRSKKGSELEAIFPLKGFLPLPNGRLLISPGQSIDLSFSLEASGELAPGREWASDTAVPILNYRLKTVGN